MLTGRSVTISGTGTSGRKKSGSPKEDRGTDTGLSVLASTTITTSSKAWWVRIGGSGESIGGIALATLSASGSDAAFSLEALSRGGDDAVDSSARGGGWVDPLSVFSWLQRTSRLLSLIHICCSPRRLFFVWVFLRKGNFRENTSLPEETVPTGCAAVVPHPVEDALLLVALLQLV